MALGALSTAPSVDSTMQYSIHTVALGTLSTAPSGDSTMQVGAANSFSGSLGTEWMLALASRDHMLAGCVSFSVFVFLAWVCAVLNGHHLKATLSEMVYDWSSPEGKIFIAALFLPAIFFLLSGYPYVLPNARVEHHKQGHLFTILRHFGVNAGLIVVAFVPTLGVVESFESLAYQIEVYVHSVAAAVAFVAFVVSELFVLTCSRLFEGDNFAEELRWRQRGLGLMTAILILLVIHKALGSCLKDQEGGLIGPYSEAWTFRYEMSLGGGLISQTQLIWHFSDPNHTLRKLWGLFVLPLVPYVGVVVVIASDFAFRKNLYALPWGALELAALAGLSCVCIIGFIALRRWEQSSQDETVSLGKESTYGSVDASCEVQAA